MTTIQFKKYDKYSDTGIQWLGKIPEHWEKRRVKSIFRLVAEPAPQNNNIELLSVYTDIGVKPRRELEERGNKASTTDGYWVVKKGDIIVNKLLAWMGAIGISKYDGVTSPAYDILRAKCSIDGDYFHYLFRTTSCVSELKKHSKGIMDMRLRLYFDAFGDVIIPFPSKKEQAAIARFLDEKTARIDEAIAKKEKMIALLNERKQIIIQNAVTKGLTPNAKMKDSGINCLSKIPENWLLKKIKHVTSKIGSGITPSGGGTTYLDEGIPLLRSQNIHFGRLDLEGVARISEKTHLSMTNSHTSKGDVLLNITGGSIGRCHYIDEDIPMNVNQHVCIVRPRKIIQTKFLNYLLASEVGQSQIWLYQQGGGREGLNFQSLKNFVIPLPNETEQTLIVSFIEAQSVKIDKAVTLQEKQIEKLKEYKAVLIDSAVTGKIKVI